MTTRPGVFSKHVLRKRELEDSTDEHGCKRVVPSTDEGSTAGAGGGGMGVGVCWGRGSAGEGDTVRRQAVVRTAQQSEGT